MRKSGRTIEVCPDNRPPRECAAVAWFAVVLARGDKNNIGPALAADFGNLCRLCGASAQNRDLAIIS